MKSIEEILTELQLHNQLSIEDIPIVDLYVDQVIQLFEKQYNDSLRNEDEKVLTRTMINNYAKGRLFFPIKNKKYTKDHLMLINLIYQLKGALSINDIKITLANINKKIIEEDFDLAEFYEQYLAIVEGNVSNFKDDVNKITATVSQINDNRITNSGTAGDEMNDSVVADSGLTDSKITDSEMIASELNGSKKVVTQNDEQLDEIQMVLLITSLINMSNFYRRLAEKLVDDLSSKNNDDKRK